MLRGLAVVVLIVGLVAAMVFGPRYLRSGYQGAEDDSVDTIATADAERCDLDVKTCRWDDEDSEWALSLQRTGPEPSDPFRLELLAPSETGNERMIAVLEGQSMYMGQYPVALQRDRAEDGGIADDGDSADDGRIRFHAKFQAPLCTIDPDMIWKITLKQGADTLDTPLIPTFQTRHPDAR